jgi:hypothetical protein
MSVRFLTVPLGTRMPAITTAVEYWRSRVGPSPLPSCLHGTVGLCGLVGSTSGVIPLPERLGWHSRAPRRISHGPTTTPWPHHENKKSLSTGEPANSGLSRMQLNIASVDSPCAARRRAGRRGLLQKVRQAHSAAFEEARAESSYAESESISISDRVGLGKWGMDMDIMIRIQVTYRRPTWVATAAGIRRRGETSAPASCADPRTRNICTRA